jgi:5-methylcytosine-specific restriction endonuclease McrA
VPRGVFLKGYNTMAERVVTKQFLANSKILKAAPQWVCHLCGTTISRIYKYPHPLSVTVDHKVPWVFSRDDSLENLGLAHRKCNRDKSDSLYTQKIIKRSGTLKRR